MRNLHLKITSMSGLIIGASLLASPAQAYIVSFGEDINSSATVPLPSFPNASAAENSFLSFLTDVGTEDFESFPAGTMDPTLTFPTPSGSVTATLSGNGTVISVPPGFTNGAGRYGTSPTNYFEAEAALGGFAVDLDEPVAAFGFYGIDIGDFGGQLQLTLIDGSTTTVTVPNTVGSAGSTDGSVLFYGIIAENEAEEFSRVEFSLSTGGGDIFAFDDFTIGVADQVDPDPGPGPGTPPTTPEPSSMLALLAVGTFGIGSKLKRK